MIPRSVVAPVRCVVLRTERVGKEHAKPEHSSRCTNASPLYNAKHSGDPFSRGRGREAVPHSVARVFGGECILDAARQCTRVHEVVLPTQTHEANNQPNVTHSHPCSDACRTQAIIACTMGTRWEGLGDVRVVEPLDDERDRLDHRDEDQRPTVEPPEVKAAQ